MTDNVAAILAALDDFGRRRVFYRFHTRESAEKLKNHE